MIYLSKQKRKNSISEEEVWAHNGITEEIALDHIKEIIAVEPDEEGVITDSLKFARCLVKLGIDFKWGNPKFNSEDKIDFIIPVWNRDFERVKRCVDSLKSENTGEIIIVSVEIGNTNQDFSSLGKVIKIKQDKWNKSHALNCGILEAKNEYVACIDCDIILSPTFIYNAISILDNDSFLISKKVKRINTDFLDKNIPFDYLLELSENWNPDAEETNHGAVGGIQIMPKDWAIRVRGYDEKMTYWLGMDTDMANRAELDGLTMIILPDYILHQEHKFKKEENLSENEREQALREMHERGIMVKEKFKNKVIIGDEEWGKS